MQQVKTIPLKLYNYGGELNALVLSYTSGMNYVSTVVYEHGKPMGSDKIQNGFIRTYETSDYSAR